MYHRTVSMDRSELSMLATLIPSMGQFFRAVIYNRGWLRQGLEKIHLKKRTILRSENFHKRTISIVLQCGLGPQKAARKTKLVEKEC